MNSPQRRKDAKVRKEFFAQLSALPVFAVKTFLSQKFISCSAVVLKKLIHKGCPSISLTCMLIHRERRQGSQSIFGNLGGGNFKNSCGTSS
jgi:hypothetical protein